VTTLTHGQRVLSQHITDLSSLVGPWLTCYHCLFYRIHIRLLLHFTQFHKISYAFFPPSSAPLLCFHFPYFSSPSPSNLSIIHPISLPKLLPAVLCTDQYLVPTSHSITCMVIQWSLNGQDTNCQPTGAGLNSTYKTISFTPFFLSLLKDTSVHQFLTSQDH